MCRPSQSCQKEYIDLALALNLFRMLSRRKSWLRSEISVDPLYFPLPESRAGATPHQHEVQLPCLPPAIPTFHMFFLLLPLPRFLP